MEKRLYRIENDKMVAGVCSGLADYFDMEVTWMRIIFVFAAIFGFSGVLIYIILWIVIPARPYNWKMNTFNTDYRVYEDRAYTTPGTPGMGEPTPVPPYMTAPEKKDSGNGRFIAGIVLIALGAFFLLDEFDIVPDWFDFGRLWPLAIVALGVLLISKGRKKSIESDRFYETTSAGETAGTSSTTTTTATTSTTDSSNPGIDSDKPLS